jgi:hypothetical protein
MEIAKKRKVEKKVYDKIGVWLWSIKLNRPLTLIFWLKISQ